MRSLYKISLLILNLIYIQVEAMGIFDLDYGYKLLKKELLATSTSSSTLTVKTLWMDQPLDHFDPDEKRIWAMRYFSKVDLWKPNGPIYIFIGGEGEADGTFLTGGMVYDLAYETNGAMFMSEHRYYGKSIPLKYTGVDSLKYLSAKQALGDLAKMIQLIKTVPIFAASKVVVIGGSYAGNLAAWMKLLYPDLVDAALASSAPVLAKKNFYEYLETVSDVYEQMGIEGCHDAIAKMFKRYEELLKTSNGIAQLKKEEDICEYSDLTKEENKQLFIYSTASIFMGNTQYGSVKSIQKHCKSFMKENNEKQPLYQDIKFVPWLNDLLIYSFYNKKDDCYDINFDAYINMIKEGKDVYSIWGYQKCNEFSYAKTTSSDKQPFTKYIPIETFYKICTMIFGDQFNEASIEKAVNGTNDFYGGLKPNVGNVIFVNGEMDPWHRLGVLEDISNDAVAKMIPSASHCLDLMPERKGDSAELLEARKYIKYLIKHWIGIEPCDIKTTGECEKLRN